MTHDLLQSDITLATKLIGDGCPDEEILKALTSRGVPQASAAKALEELRSGKKPVAQSPLPMEMTLARRQRSQRTGHESKRGASVLVPEPEPRRHRERTSHRSMPGKNTSRVVLIVTASLVVLGVIVSGIALLERSRSGSGAPDVSQAGGAKAKQQQSASPVSAGTAAGNPGNASVPLALELQPDGLHIGGSLVSGSNVLSAMKRLAGAPTRTNQVATAGTVVYAYDHHGVLVYSQSAGRTNHIVLDCEATGGANGTTSPFVGTLRVEDQVVGPELDSQTLAGNKKLRLSNGKSGSTIWGGHYHGLEVVFAYLKTPQRPSLIEIDLK
jgi:hypothetical protein